MTWDDWVCVGIMVAGLILFLYGANVYIFSNVVYTPIADIVGWLGLLLFACGAVAEILLYVYKSLTRPKTEPAEQTPTQSP